MFFFGLAEMRIVIILLETDVHLMTDLILVLFTMKPTTCCFLSPSPINQKPVVSPHLLKCVSDSPKMSHLYLSSAYVSYFSFPH